MIHNCSNGFICENLPGNYTCVCPEGYTGTFCETGMHIQCIIIYESIHVYLHLLYTKSRIMTSNLCSKIKNL